MRINIQIEISAAIEINILSVQFLIEIISIKKSDVIREDHIEGSANVATWSKSGIEHSEVEIKRAFNRPNLLIDK